VAQSRAGWEQQQTNEQWRAEYEAQELKERKMGLIAKQTGSGTDFVPAPSGTHVAIAIGLKDLGHQWSEKYSNWSPRIIITWELPEALMEDGKPFTIQSWYGNSLGPKSYLRRDLEAWRDKKFSDEELEGFDLTNILGKACLISVEHEKKDETTWANVRSVMALPKGTKKPTQVNTLTIFDIDDPDMEVFETFGDKLKETIRKSQEWSEKEGNVVALGKPQQTEEDFDDDVPF